MAVFHKYNPSGSKFVAQYVHERLGGDMVKEIFEGYEMWGVKGAKPIDERHIEEVIAYIFPSVPNPERATNARLHFTSEAIGDFIILLWA